MNLYPAKKHSHLHDNLDYLDLSNDRLSEEANQLANRCEHRKPPRPKVRPRSFQLALASILLISFFSVSLIPGSRLTSEPSARKVPTFSSRSSAHTSGAAAGPASFLEPSQIYSVSSGGFTLEFSGRGLTSLKRTADAYPTNYVLTGNPIGDVVVTYRLAGEADFKHLRQASLISPGQATDGTAVTAPAAAGASASAPPAAPVSIDNRSGANLCPDEPASKGGAFDFTPSAPLSPGFSPSDPASSARSSRLDGFPCFIPHDSTGPASTVVGQDLASPPLPLFSSFSSSCSSSVLPASLTPPAPAAPQAFTYRINPPYIPFITGVKVSASTLSDRAAQQSARALSALYDDLPIIDSKSRSTGYFSFSPKKGTVEWVQYDFPQPATATAIEIYWLDDSALNGPYQAPVRWRLLYRDARGNYLPVKNTSPYTTALDRFNRLTFEPVTTTSLRLEVEQAPGYTAGLYEWRVETDQEKLRRQAWEEESRQAARQIKVESSFKVADALLWTVSVENLTDRPLEIADLGLPLPFNTQYGWNKDETYNLRVIRHFLVAGNGSFVFCQRTNAEPPYLLMIPVGAAAFEYFDDGGGRGIFCPYLHSAWAFEQVKKEGGRWRFQTTSVQLSPHGQSGDRLSYTFKFMWAEDGYQSVRDLLYEEGKFDVQVVPGMVVPENLEALVAVRTKHRDIKLEAEFPSQTTIEEVQPIKNFGESAVVKKRKGQTVGAAANKTEADVRTDSSYRLFRIRFSRLGENIVTIKYGSPGTSLSKGTAAGESVAITAAGDDGAGSMPLEFFVTEDLETVIKKRANFLTTRQQHRDPSKWYYGVYSDWDMKNRVLRSPEDRDGLPTWLVDACDDAGNARPAFVASKNVYLPVQAEVASVDLYIKHYLWGGMQQTDDEPYPFAIYGIPNWKVNRDSPDPGRNGQKHIWRIYDYPHIVLLYHRMYQVARLHPEIKTELAADEYLRRAYRTAIAYFTVPLEVEGWSAYETPTMNEIVMNDLLRALEREGWKKEEAELRQHWEKKVRHFVEDDPYLFGSEFAFDSTGFEATGAMARYAMEKVVEGEMKRKEERSLWPGGERGDKRAEFENLKKTEAKSPGEGLVGTTTSKGIAPVKMVQTRLLVGEAGPELQSGEGAEARPGWERARVEKFMEKQVRLNVAARGWLETAYYYLGSDYRAGGGLRYTLSYMSPMGGWSILDYGLNWAGAGAHPFDYLRLGYASYLSSWALVNSGRAETGYGFWFRGEENDGGAGGGFEPMARARGWLGKWIERGAWYYSAEEDVGYCGAIRTAATVVANDPVFGLVALGGKLENKGDRIEVVPRDGLGVRFHLMASPERRLHVEFEQGRLAKEKAVVIKKDLSEIILQVEGRGEEGRAKIDGAKMAEVELVVSGLGLEYKAYDRAGQEIKGERLADGSIRFHSPSTDLVVLTRDLVVLTR
ncbi:MAG TPA: DUF5695 domain-containing protein [Candidatus Saccharicenans sp.]|nr:DUF5695 domain-containing protein [Candidatus Saccharicenans sp.]